MDPLERFFDPSNIFLVVGATENAEKYGSKVFLDLRSAGLNAVAINSKAVPGSEIHGAPAYPSVTAFLERIEALFDSKRRYEAIAKVVLVLVIPPQAALSVVKEAHLHGVKKAWFQPGAESEDAVAFCEAHGIAEVHGACIMVERRARGI